MIELPVVERLRRALTEVSFSRGLALGTLVGAAIAGSTIWSRIRGGRPGAEPAEPAADDVAARHEEREGNP